jgi:flagellar biosynthesis/type III secretory pathway protein FliH
LRSAIVVIHQLPQTPETLWLRLLGRGKVQKQAIDELESLPPSHPYRASTLKVLYALEKNLEANQPLDEDERELFMRLAPLYEQDRERAIEQGVQQGIQQGIQQGQRLLVENLLRTRFGELDSELSRIIDSLLTLPPEEFTPLLLQLSREELLARFQPES